MAKQRIGSAKFVIESTSENLARTENYVRQALTTAFPGLRNATVALAVYDEHDVLVRTVVFGNPTDEMKKLMDFEFRSDDPEPEVRSA